MTAENVVDFDKKYRSVLGGKSRTGDETEEPKPSVVVETLEALKPFIHALWHTPSREAMLTTRSADGIDTHLSFASPETVEYLGYRYFQKMQKPVAETTMKAMIALLSARARYEGEEHPVFSRIAHVDGKIIVDLGDDRHRAVCIDPDFLPIGWKVIESADIPVRFRRSKSALALPVPVAGASLDSLRTIFPNIADGDWMLIVGWLIGCFQQHGGRAFLELLGSQGSGKSTLARYLVALVDPNDVPLRSMPKSEQDLLISVLWRSIAGLDNVSYVAPELADALCRLSTGAGISTRALYSNAEESLLKAQVPVLWTAIEPQAIRRADLQDRSLTVRLDSLGDTNVRGEREIADAFDDITPDLLGAMYTGVAVALSRVDHVQIERLPRLADFALWVEASAPAFGWPSGAFLAVLESIRAEASSMAVEASAIGPAILALMASTRHWEGTAAELLGDLKRRAGDDVIRDRSFPKDGTRLSGQLRRLSEPLKAVGVLVGFDRSKTSRGITLDREGKTA